MKTRAGFVSNSSSSSFIVGLHREPKSSQDLQDLWSHGASSPTSGDYCLRCLSKAIWELMDCYDSPDDSDDLVIAVKEIREETRGMIGPNGYDDPKAIAIEKSFPFLLHIKVPQCHYLKFELGKVCMELKNTALLSGG